MNKLKKFFSLLFAFSLCFSLVSCSDDYSDKVIYYSSVDDISSFDPQLASNSLELTVAYNCFEYLLTKNKDGKIVPAAAESYSVSKDKKTYTFKIRDGAKWSDGETKVTADDFEFGIKRSVKAETNSPYVSSLYSIKNAKKINDGKLPISKLGVKADKNILTINLSKADNGFLETLIRPVCAPCNEEFFNSTNGKYGLSKKHIMSNGAFYVSSQNEETNTLIISNNSEYNGNHSAVSKAVSISYNNSDEDIYTQTSEKATDIAAIDCGYIDSLRNNKNNISLYYNTNYVLFMSEKLVEGSGNFRKALAADIDYDSIKININDYYNTVRGVIPDVNVFNGVNYREYAGDVQTVGYDKKSAEKLLGNYGNVSDAVANQTIVYPENNEKLELIANLIVQGWQKDLNIYINSGAENEEDILKGVKNGEFLMAILPISGDNNSAVAGYNTLYDLNIAENADGYSLKKLRKAEKKIIESGCIYPLISIPDAICISENIDNFTALTDGKIINFKYIKKN